MKHIITIRGTDLLDVLENGTLAFDGSVDGIVAGDRITQAQLRFGDEVVITIGEDDESEPSAQSEVEGRNMNNLNDCPHCGLPVLLCTCCYPDVVYNAADIARTELITNREVSPEEGMSDYDKSRNFISDFMCGRDKNMV